MTHLSRLGYVVIVAMTLGLPFVAGGSLAGSFSVQEFDCSVLGDVCTYAVAEAAHHKKEISLLPDQKFTSKTGGGGGFSPMGLPGEATWESNVKAPGATAGCTWGGSYTNTPIVGNKLTILSESPFSALFEENSLIRGEDGCGDTGTDVVEGHQCDQVIADATATALLVAKETAKESPAGCP